MELSRFIRGCQIRDNPFIVNDIKLIKININFKKGKFFENDKYIKSHMISKYLNHGQEYKEYNGN